jgi:transposase
MAKGYRAVVRDQPALLPVDMREWLPADHPVYLVIRAVGRHLDTSVFHAGRKTGGAGAAGYDPDMLVLVLVWAYAHGITSSRRIEELCRTDVAFRVICGGNLPDHVTIARFRAGFAGAAGPFFAAVLGLCAELGMGRLGVVALDGTKIAASASASANRSRDRLAELAERAVAAHAAADAAEDALFGPGRRGDEVPEDAWQPGRRDERIAAALASLDAERAAAEQAEQAKAAEFRARRQAGRRTGPAPAGTAVELAQERLDRAVAAQRARCRDWDTRNAAKIKRAGTGLSGPRPAEPEDYVRVRQAQAHLNKVRARAAARQAKKDKDDQGRPAPARNITDPDSRLMPRRGGGFVQGCNAQNVTSEDGLIIATTLTNDTTDCRWFEPMLAAAQDAAALITARRPAAQHPAGGGQGTGTGQETGIRLVLADAGYCSEDNLTTAGPDRLIAVAKRRDLEKAARASERAGRHGTGPATTAMAERLKTPEAITAYRRRGHIAETPHGHIKHNMGIRQLTLRGKPKATAEWTFTAAVYNLVKAISAGHLTTQALTTL